MSSFRIILALTSLPQDINLNEAVLTLTLGNTKKTIPLTGSDSTTHDFSGVQVGSKLEFGFEDAEGFMFGYSELKVPSAAFENNETEVKEQLRFFLIDQSKDSFVVNVYAIFLNRGGSFKEKPPKKEVLVQKYKSPSKSLVTDKFLSTTSSESPNKKNFSSKGKTTESKGIDTNLNAYLNKLVSNHSVQLKSIVDEHNAINEYIHLNKVQNVLPQSFGENSLEVYSTNMLRTINTPQIVAENGLISQTEDDTDQKLPNFGTNDTRLDESVVVKDFSSCSEKEKEKKTAMTSPDIQSYKSEPPLATEVKEKVVNLQAETQEQPSSIPLKIDKLLQRKFSEGSVAASSPIKKRQVDEALSFQKKTTPDNNFLNAQVASLKNVILSQNARIAELESYKNEKEQMREDATKAEAARKLLQESILETTLELKQENMKLDKQISSVLAEKEGLLKKISELQSTIQELDRNLITARTVLQEKEDTNIQNSISSNEIKNLKNQIKKLQDSLEEGETQKVKNQSVFKTALERFEENLTEAKQINEALHQEKKKHISELHQTQQELAIETASHQATKNDLFLTKKRLENAESFKEIIVSLEAQRDQLSQQLAESRSSLSETDQLLQNTIEKLTSRQKESGLRERNLTESLNKLKERLDASEVRIDDLVQELSKEKRNSSQLLTTVSSLEQHLLVKADVSKQLEATNKQQKQLIDDKKKLSGHIEALVMSQDQANGRLFEAEKENNQLRQNNEEKNQQVEALTATIITMRQSQDMYVPAKDDIIDGAVATFINSGDEISKLKVLFIREAEGVYQFGSKRIYVKLEAGKILIRIGGGFLHIDQFIEKYGPLEVDKLSRIDPLKKLSSNIAVNKTLIGKCVNQIEKAKNQAYEYRTAPSNIRVMSRSPSSQRYSTRDA